MCTVTFIARRNGYALGMNRDEKLARAAGLPPAVQRIGRRTVLCPSEPTGGTWIGVNDSGATLALINWYSITAHARRRALSRGEIVKSSLIADSSEQVDEALAAIPLSSVNPFRLIGAFPRSRQVVEWRWNLLHLERFSRAWRTHIWISSGFDETGAQQTRGKIFREALRQKSAGALDWLRRLHRSHAPEYGPYSICMRRADAATVSYTEIAVSRHSAAMRYVDGPLYRGTIGSTGHLELAALCRFSRRGDFDSQLAQDPRNSTHRKSISTHQPGGNRWRSWLEHPAFLRITVGNRCNTWPFPASSDIEPDASQCDRLDGGETI